MFLSPLSRSLRFSPVRVPRRYFSSVFDTAYYHRIFDETLTRNSIRRRIVKPFPSDKGDDKEIEIYGIPLGPLDQTHEQDTSIKSLFNRPEESPIFIQIDPTKYMHEQRKTASTGELDVPEPELERVRDMLLSDPIYPYAWEETLVNPDVLSQLINKERASHEKLDEPEIPEAIKSKLDEAGRKKAEEANRLVTVITKDILDDKTLEYYELNNVLYYSLVLGNQTVLGSTPKILKRLILGNSLSLENLQNLFQTTCTGLGQFRKSRPDLDLEDMAHAQFPELFHAPEVVYMIILMKEIAQNLGSGFRAFVGVDYVDPIADHWNSQEVEGTVYGDIVGMPQGLDTDSVDDLVEKHALLDVMLGGDIWKLEFLKNKFPYIPEDKAQGVSAEDLQKKFEEKREKYVKLRETYLKEGEENPIGEGEQGN